MRINKEWYRDKLYACWIGKNIGGTIGGPYEGCKDVLDVKGFKTEKGEPLPNDDLDLQLLWLYVLEQQGIRNLNQNTLGEYWLDWIPPHWNEYGVAKTNLKMGILPPLSGEFENSRWQTSNGAWIRSEIWAALFPFRADLATKYAAMDAMVDHGISEGTYAEMFTAALQSMAYYENDITAIIHDALASIPEKCRVANAVRLVIDEYKKGTDYITVRHMLVEQSADIGYFQAPANIGFVIIGLLYGEGDFKKSVLYAVNCGDDTDCTAATVGATMGILGGMAMIPKDWMEYIGDRIINVALNGQGTYHLPQSCTELTERVMAKIPEVMAYYGIDFAFTDGETKANSEEIVSVNKNSVINGDERYWYEILNYTPFDIKIVYDKCPHIKSGETHSVKVYFRNKLQDAKKLFFNLILPQGWSANDYDKTLCVEMKCNQTESVQHSEFEITVGNEIKEMNTVYLEIRSFSFAQPVILPIIFVG